MLNRRVKNFKKKRLFHPKAIPKEPPTKKTGWRWKEKRPCSLRFVDDGSIWSKGNLYNAQAITGAKPRHIKRDYQAENTFNMIVSRAKSKGMKVNVGKTQMLLISDCSVL